MFRPFPRSTLFPYTTLFRSLLIHFDSIAPPAAFLDLPVSEDSYAAFITNPALIAQYSSDNVTNVDQWHFVANTPGESGFVRITERAPTGRVLLDSYFADAGAGCRCGAYFPDSGGGLGPDGRQGVWVYNAFYVDVAGNIGAGSNFLLIHFDSIAPPAAFLDLPASEDSYAA